MNNYEPVIGLEIHVELKTKSKMFCQCSANYFGQEPNSNVCPVCLGLPGALPVPNVKAIEFCQMIGAALNCELAEKSKFDRKHYFYPDLPKGYQISQYDEPFCTGGYVYIPSHSRPDRESADPRFREDDGRKIGITRVHMEEDTGKLLHEEKDTLVDFNRSGVPLVEIVTEPDFRNSEEVKKFLEELQVIIRYLKVSDADMEKGSMRLEPNISLRPTSSHSGKRVERAHPESGGADSGQARMTQDKLPNYKVEVKNINSFKFVQKAIEYEIKRQAEILDDGKTPEQETRGFDEDKQKTTSQRSKEYAHDYRYFPEPDIPPFEFSPDYLLKIKKQLPQLPQQAREHYLKMGLKPKDADILVRNEKKREIFEALKSDSPQAVANVVINTNVKNVSEAKELLTKKSVTSSLTQNEISAAINKAVSANEKAVADYKGGKETAIMFLVGQVMRQLKGQADANTIKDELKKRLKA